MEQKILEKNGRRFIATSDGDRTVFIGTVGFFSNVAAQMLCHEAMEPLHWKTTGTFANLALDGSICTAVGYKIPLTKRFLYDNPLDYLETVF